MILFLTLEFWWLETAKKSFSYGVILFFKLKFLHKYGHDFFASILKLPTSGAIFSYWIFDLLPGSGILMDHKCQKVLLVLIYRALSVSFFHQGVSGRPFCESKALHLRNSIRFWKSWYFLPTLESKSWWHKSGQNAINIEVCRYSNPSLEN